MNLGKGNNREMIKQMYKYMDGAYLLIAFLVPQGL